MLFCKTDGLAFPIVKVCIPAAVVTSSVIAAVVCPLTVVPCNNNKGYTINNNNNINYGGDIIFEIVC